MKESTEIHAPTTGVCSRPESTVVSECRGMLLVKSGTGRVWEWYHPPPLATGLCWNLNPYHLLYTSLFFAFQEIKEAFLADQLTQSYLLTVAVATFKPYVDGGYDVAKLGM